LRELGLDDMAGWFIEAYGIVNPLKAEIRKTDEFDETLREHGCLDRMDQLNRLAWDKDGGRMKIDKRGAIYNSWIRYARQYTERIFSLE
jgi:hypothetical protein